MQETLLLTEPEESRQEWKKAWMTIQWKADYTVEGGDQTAQIVKKPLLELRNWTGNFLFSFSFFIHLDGEISTSLFHSLTSEGKAHVHIVSSHSFPDESNYKMLGSVAQKNYKRLQEDVRMEEVDAGKKGLKFKVDELWWNVRSRS